MITLTTTEILEWARCAKAMYARGNNFLGHRMSSGAARKTMTAAEYDGYAHIYRQWLVFDQPKAA